MNCRDCKFWIVSEKTRYGDGTEKLNFQHPAGSGHCSQLASMTAWDFGCIKFEYGIAVDHNRIISKEGAPWQNWHFDKCPECNGRGSHQVEMRPACGRCAGLGQVRHYDDGYIADASWDHPNEKEMKKKLGIWGKSDPGLVLAPVTKKNEGVLDNGPLQ